MSACTSATLRRQADPRRRCRGIAWLPITRMSPSAVTRLPPARCGRVPRISSTGRGAPQPCRTSWRAGIGSGGIDAQDCLTNERRWFHPCVAGAFAYSGDLLGGETDCNADLGRDDARSYRHGLDGSARQAAICTSRRSTPTSSMVVTSSSDLTSAARPGAVGLFLLIRATHRSRSSGMSVSRRSSSN